MADTEKRIDVNFFQLVISLQLSAMQQMGKIASPVDGKVERNLEQARLSIDMLSMLSEKTSNNLNKEEKELLDHVLFELRMNFVDESKKPDMPSDQNEKAVPSDSEATAPDAKEPE